MNIRDVEFPEDSKELRSLIYEYVDWLGIDLSYQDFDSEMDTIEKLFSLPNGQYTFAIIDGAIAGGVGFRAIDGITAEVKRLYVRPEFQGLKLGKRLMENLLKKLLQLGYKRVVLDAVPPTQHAQVLYKKMGFYEIEPYFNNPTLDTKFFEYNLSTHLTSKSR